MKKLICLFLCLTVLFSLVACGVAEDVLTTSTLSGSGGSDGLYTDFLDTSSDTLTDLPTVSEPEVSVPVSSQPPVSQTDPITDTAPATDIAPSTDTTTTTTAERITITIQEPDLPTEDVLKPQEVLDKGPHLVGLCDQLNRRLIVRDLSTETWTKSNVVWEYNGYSAAGIKFRKCAYYGGDVVIACGEASAIIVDYKTKKQILKTKDVAHNPHSVEILPNGVYAVASSTGNEVRIFGAGKTTHSDKVTLEQAHGVLWDPQNNYLWMAGGNILAAYRVEGTAANPKLVAVEGKVYSPNQAIHDLSPVYGDPNLLLITGSKGVCAFNKTTGRSNYDYVGGAFAKTQSYVPGVGNFESDDVLVFTTIRSDTLTYKEWGTDQVGIFVPTSSKTAKVIYRQCKSDAYYKVRVWSTDYQ